MSLNCIISNIILSSHILKNIIRPPAVTGFRLTFIISVLENIFYSGDLAGPVRGLFYPKTKPENECAGRVSAELCHTVIA